MWAVPPSWFFNSTHSMAMVRSTVHIIVTSVSLLPSLASKAPPPKFTHLWRQRSYWSVSPPESWWNWSGFIAESGVDHVNPSLCYGILNPGPDHFQIALPFLFDPVSPLLSTIAIWVARSGLCHIFQKYFHYSKPPLTINGLDLSMDLSSYLLITALAY